MISINIYDVTDLPHHVKTAEGYNLLNNMHLHDGVAVLGRGEKCILNAFRNRSCALLFIDSTVTAIILHSRACYFLIHITEIAEVY